MLHLDDFSTFARGKDKRKRKPRMTKAGAWTRIGASSLIGAGVSAILVPHYSKIPKTAIIGGLAGGLLSGASSYQEFRNSPYTPIGNKKPKPYKYAPNYYGIPVEKLALIKGLD